MKYAVMLGIGPECCVGAISRHVIEILDVAIDELVKPVLHPLTSELADTSQATADDQFVYAVPICAVERLIAKRRRHLIQSARKRGAAKRQDAVIYDSQPAVCERAGDIYLLGSKIVNRATAAEKVVAEIDLEITLKEGRCLRGQAWNFTRLDPWTGCLQQSEDCEPGKP